MSTVPEIRGRLGAEIRFRPHEDHTELRRELRAVKLTEYIQKSLAEAPPLTDEQRSKIAALIAPNGGEVNA